MELVLIQAIHWFAEILTWFLVIRALLSWFVQTPSSPFAGAYRVMVQLTEPFVAPIRNWMSNINTGMFDFSVLIAFFAIRIVASLLIFLIQLIF